MVTFSLSPSKQTERWIERAAHLAVNDACSGEYNLGAIIVKGGSVLSVGTNRRRNDPLYLPDMPRGDWSFCAEETALGRVKNAGARGATMYVARVTPGGRWGLARPCDKCAELIIDAGINKICYTTAKNSMVMERIRVFEMASH